MEKVPDTSEWKRTLVDPVTGETKLVPISRKERIFILAYMRTLDATKSAREAGFKATGYYIEQIGRNILGKPYIRAIVDEETKKALLSIPDVSSRLKEQASANISDFFKDEFRVLPDGSVVTDKVLDWDKLKEKGYLVKKFVQDDKGKITLELYDAQAALNLIGKHLKMFQDQLDVQDLGDVIVKIVRGVRYEDI